MATVRVEVPEELAARLERERGLLGFEDVETYLRWVVDNRAAIDAGDDQNRVLAAYAERIDELEARLADSDGSEDASDASGVASESDGSARSGGTGDADDTDSTAATTPDPTDDSTTGPAGTEAGTTVETDSDPTARAATASTDEAPETFEANLSPDTDRIADDTVRELADELGRAQVAAADEMARQAVTATRRRLGEGTGTGLDYRSTTALRPDGPRPGSDVADLDELAVPGHDEDLIERRREAVGAALAYLRDVGEARRGDFLEELRDQYPAGYGSDDGWWTCIKRGLRQVDRVDGAGAGSRTWRFRDQVGRVRVLNSDD